MSIKRRMVAGSVVLTCAIAFIAYRIYPRPVHSAADLSAFVGYPIQLTGEFDGDNKAYYLLHFDNTMIRLDHVNGSFPWPDTGQTVTVTGTLEPFEYPGLDAQFAVTECTWDLTPEQP